MKAKLSLFIILILLLFASVALAESSTSTITLQVTVLPNIVSYFDGENIIARTNDFQPLVVTKENIQSPGESGYEYTITQAL